MGLQWLLAGPPARSMRGLFCRRSDRANARHPNHFVALSADMAGGKGASVLGFTMSVCQLRPPRGTVLIQSRSAQSAGVAELSRYGVRSGYDGRRPRSRASRIADARLHARRIPAGVSAATDGDLLFVRANGATIFHPAGTADGHRSACGGRSGCACKDRRAARHHKLIIAATCRAIRTGRSMIAEKAADMTLRR